MKGQRRRVVMKMCVWPSAVCENDLWYTLSQQSFPGAYILLSHFLPPLSTRVRFIRNFDMADVSDPKIQEGSFLNNAQQVPAMRRCRTKLLFSYLAYLDVRSDKSETNWLLLDYEVCVSFLQKKVATTC